MSTVAVSAFIASRRLADSTQRRRTSRRGVAGVVSLGAAGLLAACVPAGYANYSPSAGRPATPAEALAVSTAVGSSPLTAGAGTRACRVTAIRLSTGTPGYAFATIETAGRPGPASRPRASPRCAATRPPGRRTRCCRGRSRRFSSWASAGLTSRIRPSSALSASGTGERAKIRAKRVSACWPGPAALSCSAAGVSPGEVRRSGSGPPGGCAIGTGLSAGRRQRRGGPLTRSAWVYHRWPAGQRVPPSGRAGGRGQSAV